VGKLIGPAHHKAIERIARVELVIHRVEVQTRLFGSLDGRNGFGLGADKIQLRIGHADFHQHRLQQLAIGLGQPLAKGPRRYSHDQLAVVAAFLPGGCKPGREAMRVNPPFHVLQNFFPGSHLFFAGCMYSPDPYAQSAG